MTSETREGSRVSRIAMAAGFACVAAALVMAVSVARGADAPRTTKIPFPAPESHKANWMEYHGRTVNLSVGDTGRTGESCYTCHEKTDCITCHTTRVPRDHTNTWRTRTHGFMAEGNRERCLACHREDYCIRCHNETAPRTHVGNWAQNHCTVCHFAYGIVPAGGCGVCHKTAPHM